METYKEGDKVRIKATGQLGIVRSASEPAKRSVGMEPSEATAVVDVGIEEVRSYTHDKIEPAKPEVGPDGEEPRSGEDAENVQPEPKR